MFSSRTTPSVLQRQSGAALMVMLVILIMGVAAFLVSSLSSTAVKNKRDEITANTLPKAKEALIGDAISQLPVASAGFLRLPDLGFTGAALTEGSASAPPNFAGNNKDYSVIGKFPWNTLEISPPHDGQQECLWYVVSGRFKNLPPTDALNWDTLGQIDVIDENGIIIASNLVGLIVSPGRPLDGQSRTLGDTTYTQCGGNYDVRNYLDSYNPADAISGETNYFAGSTNNRVALNTNNKSFVMTSNDHYNDQFLFVTTDEIFRPIMRRSDFRDQINNLMNDGQFIPHLQTVAIAGNKGTDNVNCNVINLIASANNKKFCENWKEMLLLANLPPGPPGTSITIDHLATPTCNRVLIFGGQKAAAQVRATAADKDTPANYLEDSNLTAFTTLPPPASNFDGAFNFDANNPSADLLRCLP